MDPGQWRRMGGGMSGEKEFPGTDSVPGGCGPPNVGWAEAQENWKLGR